MKVVLFPNLTESESRSMQRYARELSIALQAYAPPGWEFENYIVKHPVLGSKILKKSYGRRLDSAFGRYIKYPLLSTRAKGDIYHVTDHGYANLTLGFNPARTIVTCHDQIPLLTKSGIIPMDYPDHYKYMFEFRLWCMQRAAFILADSASTKRDILRFSNRINPDKIKVIPLGVSKIFSPCEKSEPKQALKAQLNIPEDAKTVLQVGASPYKNIPLLLRAIKLLNYDLGQKVWLVKVGADFNPSEKELIEKLHIGRFVARSGSAEGDEVLAHLYRSVDLLAFPSLWEGFGWPPLEAMACGTPVVASNAGSLPEVIGDAGLMVDPQDFHGLARAIQEVLTNADLRLSLIGKGLKRARNFTWERTAQETLAVYEEILNQNKIKQD